MNSKPVFFNDALYFAANIIAKTGAELGNYVLIRDMQGRIRIAINDVRENRHELDSQLSQELKSLGVHADNGGKGVLFRDDFFDPDAIFDSPDILQVYLPDSDNPIRLIDRQITGEDWLRAIPENDRKSPPRLVFYGVKGGVGRSTALTLLAYELARSGKRILLIDLDLESPGLSGLLLPPDQLADSGIVDWLVEDMLGQGSIVLERIISISPLSEYTQGEIRIAAAMGLDENFYLAKLSRVYSDLAKERFAQRVYRLVSDLEKQEQPDVVLIDSRAGLHDLAAISIMGLASYAFLFATDSAQTWQGYRFMFSHWQMHPSILKHVRDKLIMVQGLFPETEQLIRANSFLDRSYTLFSDTIYETIEPNSDSNKNPEEDAFNYDMKDTSAPHYPLLIKWNNRFQEFDPLLIPKGLFTEQDIAATFGNFIDGVQQRLNLGDDS
jgi:hypothetical protein